jgi:tRNA (adenine22-N1)-methyltransferase
MKMTRIELLSSFTKGFDTICDIGCDHGYVIIDAIEKYNVKKAIAVDVNEKPLNSAKANASHLKDKVEYILSDGLDNVNSDFDCAIMAGMGGILIKDIINKGLNKLKNKTIIIQANSDRPLLRKYLNENNFKFVKEFAINDQNKYY